MKVAIRRFTANDVAFALAQTSREGWDTTRGVFEICLLHDPGGCFIAEGDGRQVGMATTTAYRYSGWIGNLIVPPEHRQKGIGSQLMDHAIDHLTKQGIRTLRLEADPPGVKLYRRLGFVDEFESLRFRLEPDRARRSPERAEKRNEADPRASGGAVTEGSPSTVADGARSVRQSGCGRVRPLSEADLPAVAAFDLDRFGDTRSELLRLFLRKAKAAYVVHDGRWVRGYAMTSSSPQGIRLGPWVATDLEPARMLLHAMLADVPGETVAVGIPCVNTTAVELLESEGFRKTPSSLRMRRGRPICSGTPQRIYGIANGAMG
jgi:ribosomal protein S18 acetylase RimI-like enzyme